MALARELLEDEKERAEHVMLVDLGRNDLGRVCKAGSVHLAEFMAIERYSHVMHLVSAVVGELEDGLTSADALRAAFPAGTVSGAPKIRAMEVIDELEPTRRGPYAGAIGYVSYSGELDSCIYIRTIVVRDGVAYVQAGAGIVADSDPAREYEETKSKARALFKAIELAAVQEGWECHDDRAVRPRHRSHRAAGRAGADRRGAAPECASWSSTTTIPSPTTWSSTWGRSPGATSRCSATTRSTVDGIRREDPTHVVVSPGPCTPNEAGISLDVIRELAGVYPLLGVCLGHQSIGQAFGGMVTRGMAPVHGKTSSVFHDGRTVFAGIPNPFTATRYHSLVVRGEDLPDVLERSAWTEDGVVMGVRHRELRGGRRPVPSGERPDRSGP